MKIGKSNAKLLHVNCRKRQLACFQQGLQVQCNAFFGAKNSVGITVPAFHFEEMIGIWWLNPSCVLLKAGAIEKTDDLGRFFTYTISAWSILIHFRGFFEAQLFVSDTIDVVISILGEIEKSSSWKVFFFVWQKSDQDTNLFLNTQPQCPGSLIFGVRFTWLVRAGLDR